RSDHYQAAREGVLDTKASTQKQIEDLERERNGLAFRRTTKAAVDAAKLLSDAAAKAREQECGKVGDNCRKRQDAEAAALAALTKAQENKAATDRFDQIEAELKQLRAQKGETTVGTLDPLKTLLTAVIGTWADLLTAWQKAVFAVVYDTCLIAVMIGIEVLGHVPMRTATTSPPVEEFAPIPPSNDAMEPVEEPAELVLAPKPRLVAQ